MVYYFCGYDDGGRRYDTIPNLFRDSTRIDMHIERTVARQEKAKSQRAKPKEKYIPTKDIGKLASDWLHKNSCRHRAKERGGSTWRVAR